MTQAFHGADPDALRVQAAALHDAAETLTSCAQRTGAALDALAWHGLDAERTRAEWPSRHARTLLTSAVAMQEAARRLLDEADAQEAVSGVAGAAGAALAGGGAGSAPASPTGGAALRAALDAAHATSADTLDRLGAVGSATNMGLLGLAARRWENVAHPSTLRALEHGRAAMQDAHIGPAVGGVLNGITALGVAHDAYGAYRAHASGDLHGTVVNGVSGVLAAGAFVPGGALVSTALGVSWDAGTAVGTRLNDAMQGTAYHDRFTERMETAFDHAGAWGMLATPVVLTVTGVEEVGLQARELWNGLTGPGDGTLDSRR